MLFPAPNPPATPPRVVITGAGIVTALGYGWKANAEGFRSGRQAFRLVTLFDVSRQRARRAAEVDVESESHVARLTRHQRMRLDRASAMLLAAADEAWRQSGWEPSEGLPLVLGTTAGGMSLGEEYFHQAVGHPHRHRRQPTRAWQYQAQVQGRTIADALGLQGPITILSNACASGGNAIGHAWTLVRRGLAARVLAGGYDTLSLLVFAGFDSLQSLSTTTCRPFDARRDGLALGEGAGVLALESLEGARRRDALILGEIIGYATTVDGHHLTQPHPAGDAAWAAMTQACEAARITPAEVDYLNAHGTGTTLNDTSEAQAIRRWAGTRTASLPVSSTKAGIGHLLGGAGAVEAVACLMALCEQWLPPETSFETPDPLCDFFPVVRKPQDSRLNIALSNSFGFGGVNASLVLRRWA